MPGVNQRIFYFIGCILIWVLCNGHAFAGGGINWKVTVRNNTAYKCQVKINKDKLTQVEYMDWRILNPGESTVFQTGSLCPCGMQGKVYSKGNPSTLKWTKSINIGLGNTIDRDATNCSAACWNSTWELCRKHGTDADTLRDDDFSWCE